MNVSTLEQQLARAMDLHHRGRLAEAEMAYGRLRRSAPRHAPVFCMSGILACETGRMADAVAWLEQAADLAPGNVTTLINLAGAYEKLGRGADATRAYEGLLHHHPGNPEAHFRLARLLARQGDMERAVPLLTQALDLDPGRGDWWNMLGFLLRQLGRLEEALAAYERAVRANPEVAQYRYNQGIALQMAERLEDAVAAFETASRLQPGVADIENNLGNALRQTGHSDRASQVLERALASHPDHPGLRINFANCLVDLNRAREAIPHFQLALAATPDVADFHVNHGMALSALGDLAGAEAAYRRALALAPDHPDARFLLGVVDLSRGNFASGWQGYEWRWQAKAGNARLRRFQALRWAGDSLAGRRLLIHAEQGLGDEIMFASLFPEVIREAGQCSLECSPKLERLFRRAFPEATVIATRRDAPGWETTTVQLLEESARPELQIAAGSLPLLRRESADRFPVHLGYLRADPERVVYWKTRLDALGPGPKIGLSWQGGMMRTGTRRRSLSLVALRRLLGLPGLHFISLQYTPCAAEIDALARTTGLCVHHWQEAIDDYDETAALVTALDLTVSVCTAVIHLGGALGRPVWVMAPRYPEWRYGLEGETLPWYPSVRVIRQEREGEWGTVLDRVAGMLALLDR